MPQPGSHRRVMHHLTGIINSELLACQAPWSWPHRRLVGLPESEHITGCRPLPGNRRPPRVREGVRRKCRLLAIARREHRRRDGRVADPSARRQYARFGHRALLRAPPLPGHARRSRWPRSSPSSSLLRTFPHSRDGSPPTTCSARATCSGPSLGVDWVHGHQRKMVTSVQGSTATCPVAAPERGGLAGLLAGRLVECGESFMESGADLVGVVLPPAPTSPFCCEHGTGSDCRD